MGFDPAIGHADAFHNTVRGNVSRVGNRDDLCCTDDLECKVCSGFSSFGCITMSCRCSRQTPAYFKVRISLVSDILYAGGTNHGVCIAVDDCPPAIAKAFPAFAYSFDVF